MHGITETNTNTVKVYHPLDWLRDFPIWCEIVWDRGGTSLPTGRFGQGHELIYQIGKPKNAEKIAWNDRRLAYPTV